MKPHKNFAVAISIFTLLLSLAGERVAVAQLALVSGGVSYLNSTQNADGSWGGTTTSLNGIFPTTAGVLDALRAVEPTSSTNQTNAIQFITSQAIEVTSFLAARIIALASTGTDTTGDLNALLSRQNLDGGWGTGDRYGSDVLDTAFALLALNAANVTDRTVLGKALSYLTRTQNVDGGWGLVSGDRSRVFYTVIALRALNAFRLQFALPGRNNAIAFLRGSQNLDGGYGDSPSTAFETALTLLAIFDAGLPLSAAETNALNYLSAQQQANGSWGDDAYSTALALRAIAFPRDTDADGMPDDFELANMLDPNDPSDALTDFDGDGLTNLTEFRLGTKPTLADTDGDGVDDQTESFNGSDPLDPASLNRAPVIASQPVTTASEQEPYSYQVQANDPDGDGLSFSLLQAPSSMSISGAGLVRWTPTASQVGNYTVIIQVSDGRGGSVLQQYRVTVLARGIDLTVAGVDMSAVTTNTQTLVAGGTARVDIQNQGGSTFNGSFGVLIFEDINKNGAFEGGVDNVVGTETFAGSIGSNAVAPLDVRVSGVVSFHASLLYAFVDSAGQVPELDETNNLGNSGQGSQYRPPVRDFLPVVKWQWDDPRNSPGIAHSPVVAPLIDTNGDGLINERDVPAVVIALNAFGGQNNNLVALRGDTGQVIFSVPHPQGSSGQWSSAGHTPAVGDIDGDGIPEILISGYLRNPLFAFNNDGSLKWTLDNSNLLNTNGSNVVLADLDNDGRSEIIHGPGIVNYDGTPRARRSIPAHLVDSGGSGGSPQVADLDMDGVPEIVAGASVWDGNGNLIWGWRSLGSGPFRLEFTVPNPNQPGAFIVTTVPADSFGGDDVGLGPDMWTAVANLDDDPNPEIVVVSQTGQLSMTIFEHDGQIHAGPFQLFTNFTVAQPFESENFELGPPTVADFDGDGQPEIAVAARKRRNVVDPVTNKTFTEFDDPTRVILTVYESDGSTLWQRNDLTPMVPPNQAPPSSAFDFDGDGASELVFLDLQKLYILNGRDGTTLFEMAVDRINDGWPVRYPTIADVDNDGNAEIVVPTWRSFQAGAPLRNGVFVLGDAKDNWGNSRRIWNQWQYHVTNINEDSSIPALASNNWETHNNQREQVTSERLSPFAAPDLTVSRITINAQSCPVSAGITARIGNGGSLHVPAGVGVNFYLGDPSQGGALIGTVPTANFLAPGEYEDVTLHWNAPVAGQIFVTVNETPVGNPIQSNNLSLLPHSWARASGFDTNSSVPVNFNAHNGIDGNASTFWSQERFGNNIDPGPDFYEVHLPFPVNVTSVTIQNRPSISGGFTGSGTLDFSNGFSAPIAIDSAGNGSADLSSQPQTVISWIRLTAPTRAAGAALAEFIVGGSYVEPKFVINEGAGRLGNNKAAFASLLSLCDTLANLPPQITSAPPIKAQTGSLYSYQALAADPNNDPLVFSLVTAPPGMEVGGSGGLVTWRPTDTQVGNFSVIVQVSDGRGGTDEQSFTIDVDAPAGTNRPPQITSAPPTAVALGQMYQYDADADDADGDTVLFSLLQSPAGAAVDPFTGIISWTPNLTQIGSQFFTVAAQDGIGGRDTQSFAVAVSASTTPPPPQLQDTDLDGDRFNQTVDCDDANPNVNPGVTEVPGNGLDDDCNPGTPDSLPGNSLVCSVATDKRSYDSNSLAQLTMRVQNLTSNLDVIGLQGRLTVREPAGQSVSQTMLPVSGLPPNGLFRAVAAFNTGTLPPGTYEATVDVEFGSLAACQAQVSFAILSSASRGTALTGSITADPAVAQGQNSTVSYGVSNVGNTDLSTVTLRILVVDLANGTPVQTLVDQTSLNKGQSFNSSRVFNTSGVAVGDYLLVFQGESTGTSQTVGAAFMSITMPLNSPPAADAGGPYEVNEDGTVTLTGAATDPNNDPLVFTWDLDNDGTFETPGASVAFSAAGRDGPSTQTVVLRVSDPAGLTGTSEATISIRNAPPAVRNLQGVPAPVAEGSPTLLSSVFSDPGSADTHTAAWDFGDGSRLSIGLDPGARMASRNHTYADNGVYTVRLCVTDDDGGIGCNITQIEVLNVAPAVDAGLNQTVIEGDTMSLSSATFTDPGAADTHTAAIDWGDGSAHEAGVVTESAGSGTVTGIHQYSAPGTYTVTITVTDKDGGVGADAMVVTVLHGFLNFCVFAEDGRYDRHGGDERSGNGEYDDSGGKNGSVSINESARVDCGVGSKRKVEIKQQAAVVGNVVSLRGEIELKQAASVQGDVTAARDVELKARALVEGNLTAGSDAELKSGAVVQGNITAAGKVELKWGAAVTGVIEEGASVPPIPSITPATLSLVAGGPKIEVNKGQSLNLLPGSYGDLKVKQGATLSLVGGLGQYAFREFEVGQGSVINLDLAAGSLVIDVVEDLELKEGVQMVIVSGAGSSADILFRVQGEHVDLKQHGSYLGTFLAPNAKINLEQRATLEGGLYGREVDIKQRASVIGQPAVDVFGSLFLP